MALHSGVTGLGPVVKRPSSRRRARGSLVRCRAYVWTKEELARLDAMAKVPRDATCKMDHATAKISDVFCASLQKKRDGSAKDADEAASRLDVERDAADLKDSSVSQLCTSPVQNALMPAVTGVASTLIDLRL